MSESSKDLFSLGAEPIDITAAKLLWKSPWWAKALESMSEVPVTEQIFIRILGRLCRDFAHAHGRRATMEEFAELATMARKVRWKNFDGPGFGTAFIGRLRKKLSLLEWDPLIFRFEFKVREPAVGRLKATDWKAMGKRKKIRIGKAYRKWRKEHKEERALALADRENKVSKMIAEAVL